MGNPDDKLELENLSGQRISMHAATGAFCLSDMGGDISLESDSWLEAVYQPGMEIRRHDWIFTACRRNNELSFKALCDDVGIIGTWRPHGRGFELNAVVRNTGAGTVGSARIRFSGLKMPPDSFFALPHGAGFIVPLSEMSQQDCIRLHYPVFCSMQWLDVFTDGHGIYMGVCDEAPRSKVFAVGMDHGIPYMEVRFTDLHLGAQDEYALPPIRLLAHEGDWRTGAANYRSWFESVFIKPAAPDWCRESPAWAWALCKQQYAEQPVHLFSQLPDHGNSFARHGIDTLQISGYMENGHDTMFPDYEAGECMGGPEGLRSAVEQIHKDGGKLALYANGRLADPASGIGMLAEWADWCVSGLTPVQLEKMNDELRFGTGNPALHSEYWDTGGTCYKEKYGQVVFAVMCPSSREWRMHFIDRITELANRFHPDGIYLDQICGAWGLACYSGRHDHERPCDAWCGYVKLLGELRTSIKETVPGAYLASEGVNDILGIGIDLFQAHNRDFRFGLPLCAKSAPDLFISTLPNYLLFLGPVFKNDVVELRRAFTYGRGLDIAIESIDECDTDFVGELDFVMKSRRMTCPGILEAIPRPVNVRRGICCFLFMLPDGKPVVLGAVLENVSQAQREIRMPGLPEFAGSRIRVCTPESEVFVEADADIVIDGNAGLWMILT